MTSTTGAFNELEFQLRCKLRKLQKFGTKYYLCAEMCSPSEDNLCWGVASDWNTVPQPVELFVVDGNKFDEIYVSQTPVSYGDFGCGSTRQPEIDKRGTT